MRKRSMWIYLSLIERKIKGEYFTSHFHITDEKKFVKCFRMSAGTFKIIYY